MNFLKESLFIKLHLKKTHKLIVCRLYRELLKSLHLQKLISSDIILRSFLKTRISMNFLESKDLSKISQIHESYCKGVDMLELINNSESAEILIDMAYGPERFLKAFAINYAYEKKIGRFQAEKIMKEELQIKKFGYNFSVPKEFLEYLNSKPEKIKYFSKLCEPNFEKILK